MDFLHVLMLKATVKLFLKYYLKHFIKLVSMFKNILLLLFFHLLHLSSKAQDSTDLFLTEVKVFSNNSFNTADQYKKLFGYGFTVGIDFKTKSKFQLNLGIGFLDSYRYIDSMSVPRGYYYDMKYKHNWLVFNVNLKAFFDRQKQFYLETGINFDVLINTRTYGFHHITTLSHFGYQTTDSYNEVKAETYGVNIIIPIEIGYKIPIRKAFLTLFSSYNLGVSNLNEYISNEEFLFKNSYFNTGVGFNF